MVGVALGVGEAGFAERPAARAHRNLTALLRNITPAVDELADYEGERTSGNEDFVHRVAEHNVRRNLSRIRVESEILSALEAQGRIQIAGAMYNMDTGTVTFLE